MAVIGRQQAARGAAVLALLSWFSWFVDCRVYRGGEPNAGGSPKPGEHAAPAEAKSPEEKLLDDAELAIEQGRHEDALALSQKAYAEGTGKGEAYQHRARFLTGLALRRLGRDLEALISVGEARFYPDNCPKPSRDRCREHAEWLAKTFPNIIWHSSTGPASGVELAPTSSNVMREGLTRSAVEITERELRRFKPWGETSEKRIGWVALRVEPTSRQPAGTNMVALRVDGAPATVTVENCHKVGQVKIGGILYDAERCRDVTSVLPRGNFVVHVPAAEAEAIHVPTPGKGFPDDVFVMFELNNWKRTGDTWTATGGRVIRVKPPK